MTETNSSLGDGPHGCNVSEEEYQFYEKVFPNVDVVAKRKLHCTVCKNHLGAAPDNEENIRMHPVLRVTQCQECHDFYTSGEFSKGDDGSELYCRWCGQGGEVYCCSSCPFVFCKACIIENLSRGVVKDIEENESWNCFSCSSKIIWPLRAKHWALMKYIEKQKESILSGKYTIQEVKDMLSYDTSTCCKGKGEVSPKGVPQKRRYVTQTCPTPPVASKKPKPNSYSSSSILEPVCQLSTSPPPLIMQNSPNIPKGMNNVQTVPIQYKITNHLPKSTTIRSISSPMSNVPAKKEQRPHLVIRKGSSTVGTGGLGGGATTIRLQSQPTPAQQILKKSTSTITATTTNTQGPVYHTINGFRIDLNTAAKQDTFRLPNGKLIQVKRQGMNPMQPSPTVPSQIQRQQPQIQQNMMSMPSQNIAQQQQQSIYRSYQPAQRSMGPQQQMVTSPQQQIVTLNQVPVRQTQQFLIHTPPQMSPQQQPIQQIRFHSANSNSIPQGNTQIQIMNGSNVAMQSQPPQPQQPNIALRTIPTFVKQIFPTTPVGSARTQLQNQLFNTMEICHHLMTKTHTLTNSNAYKNVNNTNDIKELYIHMSYLLTYAIGRFKGLQEKCLTDMRVLGFGQEAKNLAKGQLAKDKSTKADDDDLSIVEPKTDTIELDSDIEEDIPRIKVEKTDKHTMESTLSSLNLQGTSSAHSLNNSDTAEELDYSITANLLAGMLEVQLTEGDAMETYGIPPPRTVKRRGPSIPKGRLTAAEKSKYSKLQHLKETDEKLLTMKCVVKLDILTDDDYIKYNLTNPPEYYNKKTEQETKKDDAEKLSMAVEDEISTVECNVVIEETANEEAVNKEALAEVKEPEINQEATDVIDLDDDEIEVVEKTLLDEKEHKKEENKSSNEADIEKKSEDLGNKEETSQVNENTEVEIIETIDSDFEDDVEKRDVLKNDTKTNENAKQISESERVGENTKSKEGNKPEENGDTICIDESDTESSEKQTNIKSKEEESAKSNEQNKKDSEGDSIPTEETIPEKESKSDEEETKSEKRCEDITEITFKEYSDLTDKEDTDGSKHVDKEHSDTENSSMESDQINEKKPASENQNDEDMEPSNDIEKEAASKSEDQENSAEKETVDNINKEEPISGSDSSDFESKNHVPQTKDTDDLESESEDTSEEVSLNEEIKIIKNNDLQSHSEDKEKCKDSLDKKETKDEVSTIDKPEKDSSNDTEEDVEMADDNEINPEPSNENSDDFENISSPENVDDFVSNSSANLNLIESMIKENLSVPEGNVSKSSKVTKTGSSKTDASNSNTCSSSSNSTQESTILT